MTRTNPMKPPYRPQPMPLGPLTHVVGSPSAAMLAASFATMTMVVIYLLATPGGWHWFVFPVLAAGLIVGPEVTRLIFGQTDLFDPRSLVGIVLYHLVFIAPLLHVRWDHWMRFVAQPTDWRPWLGAMAALNVLGLVAYRVVVALSTRGRPRSSVQWRVDRSVFWKLMPVALSAAAVAQLAVFARFGGVRGFVQAVGDRYEGTIDGMGVLFMVAEAFPLLALVGYLQWSQHHGVRWSRTHTIIIIVIFLLLLAVFGGLRSSRSQTIWSLLIGVGAIHLSARRVPRRLALALFAFLIAYMYLFGFYKAVGADVFAIGETAENRFTALEEETGRTLEGAILGDLARSDVQAYVLYRLSTRDDYELAYGRTYLGGLVVAIPRLVWPDRPMSKVREGTDLLYGRGSYDAGRRASRVYGLGGEAMLNFGVVGVPVAYALFGFVVGRLSRWLRAIPKGDSRRFVHAPVAAVLCVLLLISDSDNNTFFLMKFALIPALLVTVSSFRSTRKPAASLGKGGAS